MGCASAVVPFGITIIWFCHKVARRKSCSDSSVVLLFKIIQYQVSSCLDNSLEKIAIVKPLVLVSFLNVI
jgi:hypothetical protein